MTQCGNLNVQIKNEYNVCVYMYIIYKHCRKVYIIIKVYIK